MKARLDPEVYREAAARIANYSEMFCCHAICKVLGVNEFHPRAKRYIQAFAGVFMPETRKPAWAWWDESWRENRQSRLWALLLMAEMVEKGGLPA